MLRKRFQTFIQDYSYQGEAKGSSGEVVTSPPLNRKVGCSRPTMIHARCLRVRQHYSAQKNNQKNCI